MGNVDTQNRNVYLYSPLNSDIWYFIAWDNDGCLMRPEYELRNFSDQNSWEKGIRKYSVSKVSEVTVFPGKIK